ncbi:unnamed protein product, partial [Closterium sp. Naga37s-1]
GELDRTRGRPGSPALCVSGGRLAAMYHPTHHATRTDRLSPPAGLGGAKQQLLGGPSGGAGGCGARAHGGMVKEPPLPRSSAVFGSGRMPPAPATAAALSLDDSDLASVVSESWTKCAASRRLASVAPSALPGQGLPQSAANASSAPSATTPSGLPGSLSSGSRCGRFAAWGCADPLFAFERGALLMGESGISHAAETPFPARLPRVHLSAQASAGHGVARGSSASSISTSCQHSALHQRPFSPSATPEHVADCLERTADSVGARQGQWGTAEARDDRVGAGGGSSSCGKRRSAGAPPSTVVVAASSAHPANHHPTSAAHAVASAAVGWEEANGEGIGEAMGCWAEGMGEAERAEGARAEDMEEGFELSEYLSLPDDLAWCAWPACDQVAVSRAVNPAGMSAGLEDVADRADGGSDPQPNSFCRAHQALTSDARVRGGCLMSLLARMDGDGMHAHQPPASAQLSAPRSAHSPAPFTAPIATAESSPRQPLQQRSPPPAGRTDAAWGNEAVALLQRAESGSGLGAGTAPVAAEKSAVGAGARGGLQAAMDGASGEGAAAEGLLWAALPDGGRARCAFTLAFLSTSTFIQHLPVPSTPLTASHRPVLHISLSAAWFRGLDVWEDAQHGGRQGDERPARVWQGAHARWDGGLGEGEGEGRGMGAKGRAHGRDLMAEGEWADVGAADGSGGWSEGDEEKMQWQVEKHEGVQGAHAACLCGQGVAATPRASPHAAAAEAAARDGERETLPAVPAAALPAAPWPAASPLAASPHTPESAVPLHASPVAAGGGADGPSSAGAERRERRQRSSRAAATAAAAAGGASAGSEAAAIEARKVRDAATVGARAGGGREGSGAVAAGTGQGRGAAGVGGGAGAPRFVPYPVWHQPAAPLMAPMLFVQPPFHPPSLPYPPAGAVSAVMGASLPVPMRPLTHSPRLLSALPAALATPPSAPATTAAAAAVPSTAPAARAPAPASSAHASPMFGLDPSHMHHPLFPPPPALYPAPPSLHPTCAARSAAALMMAAATATAMARRRHLLGLAGEPVMKRKRGRQKKPPPRNGPCGATTNLRRIVPRGKGEDAHDEGGAGADAAGEARGGTGGCNGKAADGSGPGGGSGLVAGGAAAGVAQGQAVSGGGGGGGGRIGAGNEGRVLVSSDTACAAAGSTGADGGERMAAAARAMPAPSCAPPPALSSAGSPSSGTPPAAQFVSRFPSTASAATASASGCEGRVHGARLVSRILEMGGVEAKDCTAGVHRWKLAQVEQ